MFVDEIVFSASALTGAYICRGQQDSIRKRVWLIEAGHRISRTPYIDWACGIGSVYECLQHIVYVR